MIGVFFTSLNNILNIQNVQKELVEKEILPDAKGLYKDKSKAIDAIVISHPHLDHYGFMSFARND